MVSYEELNELSHSNKLIDRFAPGATQDRWHDTTQFFHKGTSGQWRDKLTNKDHEHLQSALDAVLETDMARWLLDGIDDRAQANS